MVSDFESVEVELTMAVVDRIVFEALMLTCADTDVIVEILYNKMQALSVYQDTVDVDLFIGLIVDEIYKEHMVKH